MLYVIAMARTDPQVNLRVPADLKDRLDAAAAEGRRSLTAEVVERLEESFHSPLVIEELHGQIAVAEAKIEDLQNKLASAFETVEREMQKLLYADGRRLPEGLFNRITLAAAANGRPVDEEVVQALEEKFPPPRVSFLAFFREKITRIVQEADPVERQKLIDEANEFAAKNFPGMQIRQEDIEGRPELTMLGMRLVEKDGQVSLAAWAKPEDSE